ncbi:hypothetical protein AB0I53_24555 [Saccharopolyspora sp. NPDC050389]|uniref:hypothetical protein n=1 Tax=Saccharopolyspora TaxID=1835 RepID=UPI0033ED9042
MRSEVVECLELRGGEGCLAGPDQLVHARRLHARGRAAMRTSLDPDTIEGYLEELTVFASQRIAIRLPRRKELNKNCLVQSAHSSATNSENATRANNRSA